MGESPREMQYVFEYVWNIVGVASRGIVFLFLDFEIVLQGKHILDLLIVGGVDQQINICLQLMKC